MRVMNAQNDSNITTLIDEAGGVDKLETLQDHENQEIYERAVRIIEKYFGADEDASESENLAPAVSATQNVFSFGVPTAAASSGKLAAEEATPNSNALALSAAYQFRF